MVTIIKGMMMMIMIWIDMDMDFERKVMNK
jgi:hypothetical protein